MKVKKTIALILTLVLFISGCDSDDTKNRLADENLSREAPVQTVSNITYLTDESQYVIKKTSDEKGQVDIGHALKENSYLSEGDDEEFILDIKGESDNKLSGMLVSYWIDKESDMFNIRVRDPNSKLNTIYTRESIDILLKNTSKSNTDIQKGEVSFFWFFRLIPLVLRVCNYTNCLERDKALENLEFSDLYIRYVSKERSTVYEGTIADFYAQYPSFETIPFILNSNVKDSDNLITATSTVKFDDVEKQLLAYLYKTSENLWLNESTTIKVETIKLDGNRELLVLEIKDEAKIELDNKTLEEKDNWKVKIKIATLIAGEKSAIIDYRNSNCGGELVYVQQENGGYLFNETITYGNCIQNCQILIKSDGSQYRRTCEEKFGALGNMEVTDTPNNASLTLLENETIILSKRAGSWDIFKTGIDGENIVNLTRDSAKDNFPSLTKDRKIILFVSDRDNGDQEIYSMDVDGNSLKRLTHSRKEDITPKASLDGQKIVFLSKRDGNYEIYTMDMNGDNQTRLTESSTDENSPSFSPNSKQIVFVSKRDGNKEIYLMDSNGDTQLNLTNNSSIDEMPNFSPDGTQISFLSNRDGDYDLWIMNIDGTNVHKITGEGKDAIGWYSWSPDGSRIVYDSKVDGDYEVYSINPDGSDLKQLTNNKSKDIFSTWSVSGNKILFVTNRDGNDDVYSIDMDGKNPINISNNSAKEVLPAVSPIYGEGEGACFIATASYGSYLASEVMVLRDFRDDYLLTNDMGSAFVEFYYATSPPIANYIAERPILRGVTRICLTPIVYGIKYGYITFMLFVLFIFWRLGLFRNELKGK